jgi:hypothetical protein
MIATSSLSNTNPDKYSEFYGYSHASLTQRYRTSSTVGKPAFNCSATTSTAFWFDGSGITPAVGDTVYNNSTGTQVLGQGNWAASFTSAGYVFSVITVGKFGIISQVYSCII